MMKMKSKNIIKMHKNIINTFEILWKEEKFSKSLLANSLVSWQGENPKLINAFTTSSLVLDFWAKYYNESLQIIKSFYQS